MNIYEELVSCLEKKKELIFPPALKVYDTYYMTKMFNVINFREITSSVLSTQMSGTFSAQA